MSEVNLSQSRLAVAARYLPGRSMTLAARLLADLDSDLAGLAEVADATGRGKTELSNRARRGDFPAPVVRLACGPVYSRSDVERYFAGNVEESD